MESGCCGDYIAAASPEMAVTENESIGLRLLCVVFIVIFYVSMILLCSFMYPELPKDKISDEESGEPLPPAVRLAKCGGDDDDGSRGLELCMICLESLEVNDVVRVLVKCEHVFHVQCIDTWCFYKMTCPVCRAPFHWFCDW